ncbi:MAG: aminotransferase class I/II-fold pyridoxal phosphate-dependent enzyme [Spirosomataceae bacterium]
MTTLQTLLESHPYCIFVVDEAYGEFGGESALHLVHKYNNLLVLKTLSKGYGLPSIRFGYVVGSPLFIESLRKHTIPFTINIFTELIVREFLTNPDFMKVLKANQERIINLRHFVFHLLNDMAEANESFSVQPSAANFLLLRFKDTELLDNIKKVLDEQHILISYPLPQCLRLTIGTEVEMCQLIRLVRRSLSQYRQYEGKGIKKLSA